MSTRCTEQWWRKEVERLEIPECLIRKHKRDDDDDAQMPRSCTTARRKKMGPKDASDGLRMEAGDGSQSGYTTEHAGDIGERE